MEAAMQIARWGNSLAVRLPAELVRKLGLKEGDRVDLVADEGALKVRREPSTDDVLADLRRFRGRLPAGERLSRDAANDR
jgi:antitoxin MazE